MRWGSGGVNGGIIERIVSTPRGISDRDGVEFERLEGSVP